jgi:hypothetical protein
MHHGFSRKILRVVWQFFNGHVGGRADAVHAERPLLAGVDREVA